MLRSHRSSGFWARAAAVAALAAVSIPQGAYAQPGPFRTPQFIATAVGFKALHETHWNWLGSDEVFVTFHDFTGPGFRKSATFDDVDAGETRDLEGQCISPQPSCDRGASSLAFGISLQEYDYSPFGYCHGSLASTPEDFERDFDALTDWCPGDDLIGKTKVKLSEADLLARLPNVGDSFDTTIVPAGGAGRYEFTYRVTRLANRFNVPPIGTNVLTGIVLQATPTTSGGSKRVTLTWTGASTTSVDIYRDGTLIVTTPNDGSYDDLRMTGTYVYRLCNLGSTTDCSAQVTAVVP